MEKRCLLAVNVKEQGIAVVCIIRVKKGPGPKFTRGVSPKKINNMLGKQIIAGQLTNKGCTVVHIHDMLTTMIFSAGITTRYINRLSNCIYD